MNIEPGSKPLDSFSLIRSSDAEEVRQTITRFYGVRRFNLPHGTENFHTHANHWQSPNIGLSYCNYGAQVQLDFPAQCGAD